MNILSPTHYLCLCRPIFCDSSKLIKTTLQELCLKNILAIESRMVFVHKSEKTRRQRYFLKLNKNIPANTSFTRAEINILSYFGNNPELSFAQLRQHIRFHYKKNPDLFKTKYIIPQMKAAGYFVLPYILSQKAKKEKKSLREKLDYINENIDLLIQNKTLENDILKIGTNIILLEKKTIERIREFKKEILKIDALNIVNKENAFNRFDAFNHFNSFDVFDSFDTGSFDFGDSSFDFDGGDSGGGGGGDSW